MEGHAAFSSPSPPRSLERGERCEGQIRAHPSLLRLWLCCHDGDALVPHLVRYRVAVAWEERNFRLPFLEEEKRERERERARVPVEPPCTYVRLRGSGNRRQSRGGEEKAGAVFVPVSFSSRSARVCLGLPPPPVETELVACLAFQLHFPSRCPIVLGSKVSVGGGRERGGRRRRPRIPTTFNETDGFCKREGGRRRGRDFLLTLCRPSPTSSSLP